ncbi:hypothetical protein B7W85_05270 [Allorhizobium ampelinum]|nr:hypothetical protein B7W85_05270 [Allorhizobium ampelinum]
MDVRDRTKMRDAIFGKSDGNTKSVVPQRYAVLSWVMQWGQNFWASFMGYSYAMALYQFQGIWRNNPPGDVGL